jgi:hypothetical protein
MMVHKQMENFGHLCMMFVDGACISRMDFSQCKTRGVSEMMWSVNLDASMSGEYQTVGGIPAGLQCNCDL